jgi:hypothetical protein
MAWFPLWVDVELNRHQTAGLIADCAGSVPLLAIGSGAALILTE